ncbi:ABC transporter permease [Caproiciproducens galactitolivorans]|uniref:Bacitracin export permease protein BceB n=1 Tax=Caproiciproducens galactitolivorans TaxID=642589 RepID=A0A4Z0YFG5_9FIRM|nr:ABC transporter permease [Caproiciproducens galactitolivorans]QEY34552.1 ABC transporter permease [Caproiciproducens galactitolivorans]TGJ77660.1 bacitracin export permease protein BceB [Caproiciproducens galactitolivorans]
MFCKLALKNVRKSIRDYTVYFLTMAFGVCLFYMFNAIDSQTAMLQLTKSQYNSIKALAQAIAYVSVFISVVLGFLIVYANRFLIKRRKKELGIYMTLGMEKGKISKMIVFETLLIGLFALVTGLIVGVFASQGLSVVTAKLFEANLKAFAFTFSINAFYKTLLYFGIIFLIVMIFNTVSISKLKLIDLLLAGKKNETLKIKKLSVSVFVFFLSVICLGIAYYLIIKNGMMQFDSMFAASIILGSLGTLLFFFSLSGFLLRVVQMNKGLYFKNLNMFILRQINSKINTTFLSMSVICIMLLITIGTLSTGMGLANVLTRNLKDTTPYDISLMCFLNEDRPEFVSIAENLKKEKVDLNQFFRGYTQVNEYVSDIQYKEIYDMDKIPEYYRDSLRFREVPVTILSISDYNNAAVLQGKPVITLKPGEFAVNCNISQLVPAIESFLNKTGKVKLNGTELAYAKNGVQTLCVFTTSSPQDPGTLIVPDNLVKGLKVQRLELNAQYKKGINEQEFTQLLKSKCESDTEWPFDEMFTKTDMYENASGLRTIVSYLAIYIGLVFLITSAAVLALQQLSEASDNTERYGLLRKLGAEEKMINRALLGQIGIYFFIPLSLALIHSVVGIHVANNAIMLLGHLDILGNILFTAAVILLIYGGYFLATYFGSKNMIRQK